MIRTSLPSLLLTLVVLGAVRPAAAADDSKPAAARPARRAPNPSLAPIADDPTLPRVLLIGDSISMGYTLPVREKLRGKANVHRIPTNGGPTTNGTANLAKWLGDAKWDVIHFNWGLHDLKYMPDGKRQVSPEDYEKNLKALVERMKATGATLVWCSTTPIPEGELTPRRDFGDVVEYNRIAARVMSAAGVETDDLYSFALPKLKEIQRPQNVHFSDEGSAVLAEQVAREIERRLPKKQ